MPTSFAIKYIIVFRSNHLNCLKNKPAGFAQSRLEFPLPGTLYTADQQCHMRTNSSYMFYTSAYSVCTLLKLY